MTQHFRNIILGQGIAGSVLAWTLHRCGQTVLIVDREANNSASKVAAGLITPTTGKRFAKAPDFDQQWKVARHFYQDIESQTGQQLFETKDMLRVFENEESRTEFLRHVRSDDVDKSEHWTGYMQSDGSLQHGIIMSPAGRLDVRAFLTATKRFFEQQRSYRCANINVEDDITFEGERVLLRTLEVSGERLILCQGAENSHFFSAVPNNRSHGEMLKVRIPNYTRRNVVHRSIWIAPNSDGTQAVGATYNWKTIDNRTTEAGRAELLSKLSRMVSGKVSVIEQHAAVRPTMKDYQPVVGRHSVIPNLFVLNGLGSKGTLRAPAMAALLLRIMEGDEAVPTEVHPDRLIATRAANETGRPRPLTAQAQELVRTALQQGDTAIDATVGNGFDTCFLAEVVGNSGHVIGFDIQTTAIESTRLRLQAGEFTNVRLRCESHELIEDVAQKSVSAVMFNLGFLPRSDHSVITLPTSSTNAITAAVRCLKPHGILTVLSYRGHAGGEEEFRAVERVLCKYADRYDLRKIESTPPKETAPILFVLTKTPGEDNAS